MTILLTADLAMQQWKLEDSGTISLRCWQKELPIQIIQLAKLPLKDKAKPEVFLRSAKTDP